MNTIPGQNPNRGPHESLRVLPQPKDTLARMKHKILIREGEGYSVVGTTEEPIELLRIKMQAQHAIVPTWQDKEMAILDDEDRMVQHYQDYKPAAWQEPNEPISDQNRAVRDRWVMNIVQWLLPRELAEKIGDPEWQAAIFAQIKEMGVEISMSPTGCGVLMFRGGESFAAWRCIND